MFARFAAFVPVMLVVGCGEAAYLSYQGRPAETALECQAAYEEAKARPNYASAPTNAAGLIGTAIGRGLSEGAMNSAYQQCLARVSALPGGGVSTKAPAATAPSPATSGCSRGGGVMQGGTGYCTR